jgi:hypothetical protein
MTRIGPAELLAVADVISYSEEEVMDLKSRDMGITDGGCQCHGHQKTEMMGAER